MSLYLKPKKLDQTTGDELEILLNAVDAKEEGINNGDIVSFQYGDVQIFAEVETTDTIVTPGEVGMDTDIWVKYRIPETDKVVVSIIDKPKSIEYIKDKLLGKSLNEEQLAVIAQDISDRKIREVEIAYFMSTFFNPGFNDDEVLWMIKGMANSGDILDFTNIHNESNIVVDKHSIGGVAAKGVTPLLVPVIAAFDLIIPNTSTRAITTPAGTSDILEYVMPIALSNQEVLDTVEDTGACMIWGGALKLSPADDVLINVEKGLHIQSFQKMLVSIVAKKVSMGITHIIIDIPYGPGTKVEDLDNVDVLREGFKEMFSKVGIKADVFARFVKGPDGKGIGPALEIRDILRVFENSPDKPEALEDTALKMAGELLELSGKVAEGKGYMAAKEKLHSGEAYDKFWEIAMRQGATEKVKPEDIELGQYSETFTSPQSGVIESIDNKKIVGVARALGNPTIKNAGIYFENLVGEEVEEGADIMTLYATSPERLEAGKKALNISEMIKFE